MLTEYCLADSLCGVTGFGSHQLRLQSGLRLLTTQPEPKHVGQDEHQHYTDHKQFIVHLTNNLKLPLYPERPTALPWPDHSSAYHPMHRPEH